MLREEYGEHFNEHFLEQYKLYVEMADRVSERRAQTNRFYVSLLSGLLALISILRGNVLSELQTAVFVAVAILGLLLCILWYINIRSYRQLNSGKYKIIHEMEQRLPFPCYNKEWEILGKGKSGESYLKLTRVEQYVPIILAVPYAFLLINFLWVLSR